MNTKKMKRGKREVIVLETKDAAFVFRHEAGMELFLPTEVDQNAPASDEAMTAAMLGWIMGDKAVFTEMQRRFTAYCNAEGKKRRN